MSSRRASLIDKEPVELARSPTLMSPQQPHLPSEDVLKPVAPPVTPVEETQEAASVIAGSATKERNDGRTTRARTVAIATTEEPSTPTPVTTKRKSDATPIASSSSTSSSRQRHRSGADLSSSAQASGSEQHSATESHKMTREERKLQSVLKIIEKMESNQKKKESRQNQKKDKTGKDKKAEDRETDHDEDSQSNTSMNLAPIRFAPSSSKKKGRKRGRSGSKSSGSSKPQMISQRNSGSIADLRSTSTESDFNSADEAARAGMSPLQENMGPNFRLPKKKVTCFQILYNIL